MRHDDHATEHMHRADPIQRAGADGDESMGWVADFYAKQDAWSGVYTGSLADGDPQDRVRAIERLAGPGPHHILELGAGGGQTAAALADAGHDVVAVELVPAAARYAQALADRPHQGSLAVVCGDFYAVSAPGPFDVVCYWDGFGVGSDADQRGLLARIASWLGHDGCALIDIYTPWYWARMTGRQWAVGTALRRHDFDADGCRMLDRWWPVGEEQRAVTQSLRCYAPADLRLVLEGTGLRLTVVEPGGAVDDNTGRYQKRVPLATAMMYRAKLVRLREGGTVAASHDIRERGAHRE